MTPSFADRLAEAVTRAGAPACVGLDPHLELLPPSLTSGLAPLRGPAWREAAAVAVERFCLGAIEALAGTVPVVKPQSAFFERLGAPGAAALERVVARARAEGLLVVLDAKRGDIGSTAAAYAAAALDPEGPLGADAVTVSPWLGPESLAPFLWWVDRGRGMFVLVRTSNPGAAVWQGAAPEVAAWVDAESSRRAVRGLGPVGAVVGATLPDELALWRQRMPHAWLLLPGVGTQGGTVEALRPAFRADGLGVLVSSSRAVLFGEGEDWRQGIASRATALRRELSAASRSPAF